MAGSTETRPVGKRMICRLPNKNTPSRNPTVKKLFSALFVAIASPSLLSGCLNSGSPADPPSAFTSVAGDGRVVLTWNAAPGVSYWLFTATDPSLTAFNWTSLPNARVFQSAATPFYMCGLLDGTQYWYAANGRVDGGPGGSSSPTISATPYKSGSVWSVNTPLIQNSINPNLFGAGYASLTTCSNNSTSAAGSFAAVGASGAIFTSSDGASWVSQAAPAGFTSDLYAVTGYAANLNNPGNPALRWVAVGAGGASVYSTDGLVWAVGTPPNSSSAANPNNHALRSLTQVAGTFLAVGDTGTILSGTDGIAWTSRTSGTTANLNGVTHGSIYVAVGDNGTILTSPDGITWTSRAPTPVTTNILRHASSILNTYVGVGDNGTIVTSTDGGTTWTAQLLPGAPNLVSVAANSQLATLNSTGVTFTATGIAANSQFVAVDSSGNAYTSVDGANWSTAIATGVASVNALVSSGFGYVAAGNAGATVTAF